MKAKNILRSLGGSKFRHGGWAALMVVAVLALIVVVNVLVGLVPARLDLTESRLFSLSEETTKVLDGLTADVSVTTVSTRGNEDPLVKEILGRYAQASSRVKLATVDPERNPTWAKQYDTGSGGPGEGSVVVARGSRFREISPASMYNFDMSGQQPRLTSLAVEQRVTSALLYVSAARSVTLWSTQGHGEKTLDDYNLASAVDGENYERKDLGLLTVAAVPPDADMVLVLAPASDFPAADAEKLRAYLEGGGRAVIVLDVQVKPDSLPNLAAVLQSFGVAFSGLMVVESDANRAGFGNPLFVIPAQSNHEILAPLRARKYPILMPFAQPVRTLELRKRTLKIQPLLESSAISLARKGTAQGNALRREAGDEVGPFTLAAAITNPGTGGGRETRIVVIGGSSFLVPEVAARAPGNVDFFLNAMGWLKDTKDTVTVRAKSMIEFPLTMSAAQRWIFSAVVVLLVPLAILGWGLAVWIRRRHL